MRNLITSKLNVYFLSIALTLVVTQTWSQSSDASTLSDINESAITITGERYTIPKHYRTLHINKPAMQQLLAQAPAESSSNNRTSTVIFPMPMPDGTTSNFRIVESEVMAPALAAQFPDIKTYSGQGIDDPTAIIKLDMTPLGFHAMVLSSKGSVFINPYCGGTTEDYICYYKRDLTPASTFVCGVENNRASDDYRSILPAQLYANKTSGTQLRTYRLALACTGEYAAFFGGTVNLAMAGMVTTMNRVNGVYETEVAIHMTLVPNNNLLVYTNGTTDPYTNSNGSTMLGQNVTTCNSVIGSANYDIGHVFSTGGGGIAGLGVVCGNSKANGVTGSPSPAGDGYDIDYVAHEMGHQFGGNHTFNSQTSSCGGGNRSANNAYESGSGITIMAYAGICGTDNLAAHSIAYFHTRSFDEIVNFSTTGGGNACAAITSTGNTAPVVTSMGSSKSIPISTPFILTGAATDANSDPITYSWEEYDLGPAGAWNVQSTTAPMFRPFSPVTSPSRTFPKLSDIINNTTTVGELLANQARTLKFQLTVRDNRTGGGGVMHPDTTLNIFVVNNGGAFAVTAPNTAVTWAAASTQTVTWNVNGTTVSPISCANVNILLSTDGGNTFPTTLLANTPNDGSENITVPVVTTTTARIKVEAVGNIFFDMSNTNFTITNTGLTAINTSAITPLSYCAGSAVSVPFTTTGTANAGNIFAAQISNSSGSFAAPVAIGTLTSTTAGTIAATIPGSVTSGTGYRIRVVSSSPIITGSDNGSNISVTAQVGAAGSISGPAIVCAGTTVAYSVPVIGNATTHNWTLPPNATIQTGAGTSSITVAYATNSTSGNVTVAGANGTCTGTSSTLAVTVNPSPGTPTAGNVSGCSGTPISLSGNPSGGTFSVANPYTGPGTTYTYTATNGFGCSSTSAPASITVNALPSCSITGDSSMCPGSSAQLCAAAIPGTYQWSTGATTQCITVTAAGTYTVTVTNANGCTNSCSKTLTVNSVPVCSISGNTVICPGSSVVWCAPAGIPGYLWSTGATIQCVTLFSAGGFYTVTVTDANGCTSSCSEALLHNDPFCSITGNTSICPGGSAQWCASAIFNGTYLWSTGASTQCITVSAAGTYAVTVTDANGCTSSCSKTLTINPAPTCAITGNSSVCSGSSVQWCASAGMASYVWSNGASTQCITLSAAGTYGVTVTDANGCTNSCSKALTVSALPAKPSVITATGGNTKMCPGDSKVYSINNVAGATSYTWTPPAGAVVSAGQGTTTATIDYTGGFVATDSLKVAAVNACGTGVYRAIKITRGNKPAQPSVITGDKNGVCNTTGVPYSVINVAGVTYNWTNSNSNYAVATGQGSSAITADFNAGYVTGTLTVTPGNGCGTGTARNLTVKATPATPGSITGATTVCANQSGVPYSITSIASAVNYTWVAPAGAHVNDGSVTSTGVTLVTTATNVTVNFGSSSGNVKVRANNACGNGTYKTLAVAFNCREANNASSFEVNLFPNPADDEMTVSFNSITQSSYSIRVNDIIGNTLIATTGVSEKGENSFKLSLEDITPGIYLVEIKNGDMSRVMKLVVN